ncbi:MAG TPA: hypothetical protein VEB22_00480, partial [Phycisphaerales bacterium]|nr:hypothetical protein [Phycisphaerales bacterium]
MSAPTPSRRAFVLPLVMILALVAGVAMVILFTRRGTALTFANRQSDNYVAHHFQSGLRDTVTVVLQVSRRARDSKLAGGMLAFDMALEDGLILKVRMLDAEGSVVASADPKDSIRLNVLRAAALRLLEQGLTDERYIRASGPARVSLHGAPRPVLAALAEAVDPSCDADAFATAVVEAREQADITAQQFRSILGEARVKSENTELFEAMISLEPQLWWVQATVFDRNGKALIDQG